MRLNDWRHDAEQYRDIDKAAQAEAERELDARVRDAAPILLSALIALEQAYSNKHSPQHRAACLAQAQAAIAKAGGADSQIKQQEER